MPQDFFDTSALKTAMYQTRLASWADSLDDDLRVVLGLRSHGDEQRWQQALAQLPKIDTKQVDMDAGTISLQPAHSLDAAQLEAMEQGLRGLMPWRKGPFDVHGIHIDTEWRSDWKWQRVAPHIQPLANRVVLDVGCGSGYHGWRMAEAGAQLVLGIDPGRLFYYQYQAIRQCLLPIEYPFYMLPFGIQHLPENLQAFDTVFSMGILYHRRSPLDHLLELKNALRPGGELVLETLVIDGEAGMTLLPKDRYAKMRNVWFIPSPATLVNWLERAGFSNVRVVDDTVTTVEEQRATDWMRFESLADFLDPEEPGLTVEGYPAPKRAILIASA